MFEVFPSRSTSLECVHRIKVLHAWYISWQIVTDSGEQGRFTELARSDYDDLPVLIFSSLFVYVLKDSFRNHLLPSVHDWVDILSGIPILD